MLNLEGIIHMKRTRFLTLSFLLALSGFGTAYAQAPALTAGTYKLAISSKAPCDLTLAADGTLTQAADCATGASLGKLIAAGSGYELTTASGEIYALLKLHGDTIEGSTIPDGRKLVLTH
jgi:hypothetical protein